MKTEADDGVTQPQPRDAWGPQRPKRQEAPPLGPLGGARPAQP